MIRKLLKNPLFELTEDRYNKSYKCHPNPISIEGYLPKNALTIRTKKRKLTPKQRKELVNRLKHAREAQKRTNK